MPTALGVRLMECSSANAGHTVLRVFSHRPNSNHPPQDYRSQRFGKKHDTQKTLKSWDRLNMASGRSLAAAIPLKQASAWKLFGDLMTTLHDGTNNNHSNANHDSSNNNHHNNNNYENKNASQDEDHGQNGSSRKNTYVTTTNT